VVFAGHDPQGVHPWSVWHEDTQDHYHSAVTIEKIHKHCSILQISFSIFISYLKSFVLKKEIDNCAYSFPQQTYIPEYL